MSSKSVSDITPEVILLGADGYLGRHLAHVMKQEGCPFLSVGRRDGSIDGHVPYVSAQLTDLRSLVPALQTARVIYLFAGRTGTLDGFDQPDEFLDSNERGLLHLLNLIRATGNTPRLVFPSTRLVYQGDSTRALPEDAPKECKTIYAANKLAGESYLRMYRDLYGLPYTVFRICVPFGNSVSSVGSYGTMQHFITRASRGEDLTIFGDGEQRRTLIHAEDLSRVILQASRLPGTQDEIYNVGGADVLTIAQVARRIAEHFGVAVSSVSWPEAHQRIETGDTVFDDTLLREQLTPRYEWTFNRWLASLDSC